MARSAHRTRPSDGGGGSQVGLHQLTWRTEHGDHVARGHLLVPPRCDLDHRGAGPHHGQGDQVAVQASQRAGPGAAVLANPECRPLQAQVVGPLVQAGLDEGRGGQSGHVEHVSHPDDVAQGPAHRRVGDLRHHPEVGSQVVGHQGTFQGPEVVPVDADDRHRLHHPGSGQHLGQPRRPPHEPHAPVVEQAEQPVVGVVIDHHDRRARTGQLLDDPDAQRVQPTDDDVPARSGRHRGRGVGRHGPSLTPGGPARFSGA
jgi:hypothetical protein